MLLVRLLGEQAIIDDVTAGVPTRSHRSLALVAYLALHAHAPQPRQRIAGLFWPDSSDAQALINLRRELHPTSAGGGYVNFLMDDEGPDRVHASYRGNFGRLARVKRNYAPDRVFHLNQNIAPETRPGP